MERDKVCSKIVVFKLCYFDVYYYYRLYILLFQLILTTKLNEFEILIKEKQNEKQTTNKKVSLRKMKKGNC